MTTPLKLASATENPAEMEMITNFVGLIRMALAGPLMHAGEEFHLAQSLSISAAATYAGMTAGHMIAIGAINERADLRKIEKALRDCFAFGVEQGKIEAMNAMVRSGLGGTA